MDNTGKKAKQSTIGYREMLPCGCYLAIEGKNAYVAYDFLSVYHKREMEYRVPLDKIHKHLEYLKENRIPTALASSTRRTAVMEHLDRAGITSYFQKIICGDMVEHGKPAPDIYLKACEELGVAPGQALAVEDSFNGIRSAYAAGLYTVMVPDQLPPTEEILALVDKKCDSLTELQAQLTELLAVCGD